MKLSCHCIAASIAAVALACVAPARAGLVDYSPDGREIAYEWSGGISISAITGGPTETVAGGEGVRYVRWSPTGRQLAFVTASGPRSELKLYNPATKRTRGMGGNLRAPFAWREDGNRFACVHDLEGGKSEIVWYNLAENGVSFRVALPYAVDSEAPMVWLPNTDDLAFVAADHNVYTVESGEFKKVTTSGDVLGMNLYAGGKKLVWARRGPNLRYILMSVYAYDLTARNVVRLPFPDRVAALNPNPRTAPQSVDHVLFSPDGSRVLLFVILTGAKGAQTAIYTVSMDGRQAKAIVRGPAPSTPAGLSAAWSRDGQSIAVRSSTPSGPSLITTSTDGMSGPVRVRQGRP